MFNANQDLHSVRGVEIQTNKKTERVVRNFKPGKLRRLPEAQKNLEHKLSQLADSNMTPLGLFN